MRATQELEALLMPDPFLRPPTMRPPLPIFHRVGALSLYQAASLCLYLFLSTYNFRVFSVSFLSSHQSRPPRHFPFILWAFSFSFGEAFQALPSAQPLLLWEEYTSSFLLEFVLPVSFAFFLRLCPGGKWSRTAECAEEKLRDTRVRVL